MEIADRDQMDKAKMEDLLMDLLYEEYGDLVFHGGTCIWRCYGGNRFSKDIDFYYKAGKADYSATYRSFIDFFQRKGLVIKVSKHNNKTNTMQFIVEGASKMKVDVNLDYRSGSPAEYTRTDGSKIVVSALLPGELLGEKMDAYDDKMRNRSDLKQPEVQDLYDIYFLTTVVKNDDPSVAARLLALADAIEASPPANIRSLESLILNGKAPTLEFMLLRIRAWCGQ